MVPYNCILVIENNTLKCWLALVMKIFYLVDIQVEETLLLVGSVDESVILIPSVVDCGRLLVVSGPLLGFGLHVHVGQVVLVVF